MKLVKRLGTLRQVKQTQKKRDSVSWKAIGKRSSRLPTRKMKSLGGKSQTTEQITYFKLRWYTNFECTRKENRDDSGDIFNFTQNSLMIG